MIQPTDFDYWCINRALELAASRRGFCAPNPSVGAVVAKNGRVLAEGHHPGPGYTHAERDALDKLDKTASKNATLYVTLEPCSHHGRTPPCTDIIIEKGLSRVIYGYNDPNPTVQAQGAQTLQLAGIECEKLDIVEIDKFYASYHYWTRTRMPYVTAKLALSLDGRTAKADGGPVRLTNTRANEYTHYSRLHSDAILTTADTIIADDPRLDARTAGQNHAKTIYIIDSYLRTPPESQIFNSARHCILLHLPDADLGRKCRLMQGGVSFKTIDQGQSGHISLASALYLIGQNGVHDLWVEAGGRLFQALKKRGLLNRSLFYITPIWLGNDYKHAFESFDGLNNALSIRWSALEQDGLCDIEWRK